MLEQVRIIESWPPFWLRKNMCAVVLNIENTVRGVEWLAMSGSMPLSFCMGLRYLKYLSSCRNGYGNSVYEVRACAKGLNCSKLPTKVLIFNNFNGI